MVIVILLVLLLAAVIYGGVAARHTVSRVNLLTVPGALLGCVGLFQFLLYVAAVAPIALLLQIIALMMNNGHNIITSTTHSFQISLHDSPVQISDIGGLSPTASEISRLTADIEVAGADWVTTLVLAVGVLTLWILALLILRHSKAVLRSLYDRTPFTVDNPLRLRRIALYWLAGWLVFCALSVGMTLYLQGQLAVSGAELRMVPPPVLAPLIVAGLLIVLSEVFRVGYELKEENALTV